MRNMVFLMVYFVTAVTLHLTSGEDVQVGFFLGTDNTLTEEYIASHGGTIIGVNAVKSTGYLYALSAHFIAPHPVYLQIWKPINDIGLPDRWNCRLAYSQKIQPAVTNCRSDIYLDVCIKVEPGDLVGLYSSLVPWGVSVFPHSPDRTIYVYGGYQLLFSDDLLPTVGNDYLLGRVTDFEYTMSFVAHVSTEDPAGRLGEVVQFSKDVVSICSLPTPGSIHWEENEMTDRGNGWATEAGSFLVRRVARYGMVTGFKAFVTDASEGREVTFQLWKPADLIGWTYELLAEYKFTASVDGIQEFTINEDDQIEVEPDYQFAIQIPHASSPNYPEPIGSVDEGNMALVYGFYGKTAPVVGNTLQFDLINYPVKYSVGVAVKQTAVQYSTSISCTSHIVPPPVPGSEIPIPPVTTTPQGAEMPDRTSNPTSDPTSGPPTSTTSNPTGTMSQTTTEMIKVETSETNNSDDGIDKVLLYAISGGSAALIIIMGLIIIFLCQRRRPIKENPETGDDPKQYTDNKTDPKYENIRESGVYDELNEKNMLPGNQLSPEITDRTEYLGLVEEAVDGSVYRKLETGGSVSKKKKVPTATLR